MLHNINYRTMPYHYWKGIAYSILIAFTIASFAGCMISSPAPSDKSMHPTSTNLATSWSILEQRSIHIPTLAKGKPCPITNDNVLPYFGFTGTNAPITAGYTDLPFTKIPTPVVGKISNEDWLSQKVLWVIQKSYEGPILIRGRQIDGTYALRFNGGLNQMYSTTSLDAAPLLTELRLLGSTQYDSPNGWASNTRVQAPGCYIYQIDGLNFSGYFIFRAVFEH